MEPKSELPDLKNRRAFHILEDAIKICKLDANLLIGITGAGGAGKTTFAQNIVKYYGKDASVTIDLDDYLISREDRGKLEITGYNPRANQLYLAREQLEHLVQHKAVNKPRYSHSSGESLKPEIVEPRPLIIVEGVTTLYPELRELFEVSFFLDALEETQIKSRINRDVKER